MIFFPIVGAMLIVWALDVAALQIETLDTYDQTAREVHHLYDQNFCPVPVVNDEGLPRRGC